MPFDCDWKIHHEEFTSIDYDLTERTSMYSIFIQVCGGPFSVSVVLNNMNRAPISGCSDLPSFVPRLQNADDVNSSMMNGTYEYFHNKLGVLLLKNYTIQKF